MQNPTSHLLRQTLATFVLALASFPLANAGAQEAPDGFTSLFNGKDLSGWQGLVENPKKRAAMSAEELAAAQKAADQVMNEHWKVVDGVLTFDGEGKNTALNLCTTKEYGDFELYVDWKIEAGGDSGIYLRGSPQVQIWDPNFPDYWKMGAEKGSGALWNNKDNPRFPLVKADKPIGEWNTFHIRMVGERVTVRLNGKLVVDDTVMENFWDRDKPIYARGAIELQNHNSPISFRNIYLREIPADEADQILKQRETRYTSIFNGKDLTGWNGAEENYEVKDGAIYCKEGKGGLLLTDKDYADFEVRLDFKLPPGGNNGLVIRYPGKGHPHIDGFAELQVLDSEHEKYAELHPTQFHGSVYGLVPAARGYLRPTGEWNHQEVRVRGSKVKVELNGFTILDADVSKVEESMGKDGKIPPGVKLKKGKFGFAGHNDPVAFRNIEIRDLPGEDAELPSDESAISPKDGPIQIFNGKNLAGLYPWLEEGHYGDSRKVFTVQDDGTLRVSGEGYGGLSTLADYKDYHMVSEFKWGGKTWANRVDRTRDSGILVHAWGPEGAIGGKWLTSVEAQIIEGGIGDILVLTGTDPHTGERFPVTATAETTRDRDNERVWKKGGEKETLNRGRINWWGRDPDWKDVIGFRGKEDVESPLGEWTRMDVVCDGGKIEIFVNGIKVNEVYDVTPAHGKLQLQTEQAELIIRRWELWPIGKAPAYKKD